VGGGGLNYLATKLLFASSVSFNAAIMERLVNIVQFGSCPSTVSGQPVQLFSCSSAHLSGASSRPDDEDTDEEDEQDAGADGSVAITRGASGGSNDSQTIPAGAIMHKQQQPLCN